MGGVRWGGGGRFPAATAQLSKLTQCKRLDASAPWRAAIVHAAFPKGDAPGGANIMRVVGTTEPRGVEAHATGILERHEADAQSRIDVPQALVEEEEDAGMRARTWVRMEDGSVNSSEDL